MEDIQEKLLGEGRVLPIMEEFYSLQGEGFNTGQASYFLRIGGCDVGCHWCDVKESWNAKNFPPISVDEVVARAASYPAKAIVITGGEPLLYNLGYLCNELKNREIRIFLETSGSQPFSGFFDWVCLSPKRDAPPLQACLAHADELKVIVFDPSDFSWAEENAAKVNGSCRLYLQPEWSHRETMMPAIVRYIEENPKWKISLQSHKYMQIP